MSDSPRKIIIVGGVAGGASAATRARRLNESAEIILFEKDNDVSFANCGLPYHIGEEIRDRDDLVVATPEFLRKRFRLDVRNRQEVIAIDRARKLVRVRCGDDASEYEESYDKLILCTGATPLVPPVDGVKASNVMTLRNLADMDRIKSLVDGKPHGRVVIVGAGFIGLEMVEQMVHRKWDVVLVERQKHVLHLLDQEMVVPIEATLRDHGVELQKGVSLARIELDDSGLAVAAILENDTRLECDLIVLGIGVRPNIGLAKEAGIDIGRDGGISVNAFLQTSDPNIYAAGDAVEYVCGATQSQRRIALAGPANRAGRLAGQHAATDSSSAMASALGTSIVRVFNITAGLTGLSAAHAARLGLQYETSTIIAKHHAGYFPGAQAMTLKLVFDPNDGRVLGAQAVGGLGVDKRIDVVATAMHFGATVRDLTGLDLAYAPPYGSAKDPIHQAAFVACNQLDGFDKMIAADADLSDYQVIDVRSAAETTKAPLMNAEHAIHIPIDELRNSIDKLDSTCRTVVSCATGVRGHIAARILAQHGFDVWNLTGGATLRNRHFLAHENAISRIS